MMIVGLTDALSDSGLQPDTELIINWGHRHQEEQPTTWEEPPDGHLDGYVSLCAASQAFRRALRVCAAT